MFRESFLHVGGAMALNEGSHGTNLSAGLWYPPKSYYLEGDSRTAFQRNNNPHISGETCGSVFWIKLNQRFHALFPGDERYVAEIERSLLNVGISNQAKGVGAPLPGVRSFALLHGHKNFLQNISTCCEGQGTRLHGSLPEYLFALHTDAHPQRSGLSVDIYAAASIDFALAAGVTATLSVRSSFPYPQPAHEPVTLTLRLPRGVPTSSAAQEFAISLRIPHWVTTPTVRVALNGNKSFAIGKRGGYLQLVRRWAHGDVLSLNLPMGFRTTRYVGKNQIEGSTRWAYEFGPSLLVARPTSANAWTNHTDCLHLHGVNASAPSSWLRPMGTRPPLSMRFAPPPAYGTGERGAPLAVDFVPYFEVADEQMTAYPAYSRFPSSA